MNKYFAILLIVFIFTTAAGQTKTDLQKLVETEIAFAAAAEVKGTKAAFLEFLADDGLIFRPEARNGKDFWETQSPSISLLSWSPAWADVSSDGSLGYTTGGWALYPKGRSEAPTVFGEYVTIWKKQENGVYRAVLDIGISHPKPEENVSKSSLASSRTAAAWKSPDDAGAGETKIQSKVTINHLTDIFSKRYLSDSLFRYLATDAIVLREGHMPFVGKTKAFLELEKYERNFPLEGYLNFDGKISEKYGNMMYAYGVYKLTYDDKTVSRWNFLQIWKYRENRWQIVLDLFAPLK
jgi:hypothetical protein